MSENAVSSGLSSKVREWGKLWGRGLALWAKLCIIAFVLGSSGHVLLRILLAGWAFGAGRP